MEPLSSHALTTTRRSGTILPDFDMFLTYIQKNSPFFSHKIYGLPPAYVAELNHQMSNPLSLHLKKHHLPYYPHLDAFYSLSLALGLLHIDVDETNRRYIFIDSHSLANWQTLNSTEKYCNLLMTWLLRNGLFYKNHAAYSKNPYIIRNIVKFFLIYLQEPYIIDQNQPTDPSLTKVGWRHLALLELFGLVTIQDIRPSKRWSIAQISATALGWHTVDLFRKHIDLIIQEYADPEHYQPLFYQAMRSLYPAWHVYLLPPLTKTRINEQFIFKASLTKTTGCQILISGSESLDTLAQLIFKTFGIDTKWYTFYEFTFTDRHGLFKTLWPDKPMVSGIPILVGDMDIIPGNSLVLSYDFDDLWTIEVRLEKIENKEADPLLSQPLVTAKKGKMPALEPFKLAKQSLNPKTMTQSSMKNLKKTNKKFCQNIQAPSLPGAILKDFNTFLKYLQKNCPILTSKKGWLPGHCASELNRYMSHRLRLSSRVSQPLSYPSVNALYLLSRTLGLLQVISKNNRRYLILNKEIYISWQALNATEKYFNLMRTWLLRCNLLLIEHKPHPQYPNVFRDIVKFFLLYLKKTFIPHQQQKPYSPLNHIQLHNVALLEMFGMIRIQDKKLTPQKHWQISEISATPFGKHIISLFRQNLDLVMDNPDYPEAARRRFYDIIQSIYPKWQICLNPVIPKTQTGTHFFKVSLTKNIWCRIRISGSEPIEALTDLIFKAFRIDNEDHYYFEFKFTDRYGIFRCFAAKDFSDSKNPESDVNSPCVGDIDILPGDSAVFSYNEDGVWTMDVRLEKIDNTGIWSSSKILVQHGQGPIIETFEEDAVTEYTLQ